MHLLSAPSNCAVCCAVVRSVFSDTPSRDTRLQADGLISHAFASNAGHDEKEEKARSCVEMKDYKEATKRTI